MALRSDAAGDRVYRTGSIPNPSTAGLTVCGWFRVRVSRSDYSAYFRTNNGGTIHNTGTGASGLGVNLFTTSGTLSNTYANSIDQWIYIAVTETTAGVVRQWVLPFGGSIVSQSGAASNGLAPSEICILGRGSADSSEWMNGEAAHVRVFTATLTQAEIEAEAASMTPVKTPWADWPLVANLNDASGNGRHLTVVSGTPEYTPGPLSAPTAFNLGFFAAL